MSDAPSTQELIRRTRNDRAAFAELYRRVAPSVFVWARLRIPSGLHHRLEPEDVLQEVWFRAMLKVRNFDATKGSFRAWVFGIANRTIAEELRKLNVRRGPGVRHGNLDQVPASITSVSQHVSRRDDIARLLATIERLDEDSRRLLMFRGLEGLPHSEVGARLGISAGAAEVRWRRLREQLRAQLRDVAEAEDLFES